MQDFLFAPSGVPDSCSCRIATVREENCHPDRLFKNNYGASIFVLYFTGGDGGNASQDWGQVNCIVLLRPCWSTTLNAGIAFELTLTM